MGLGCTIPGGWGEVLRREEISDISTFCTGAAEDGGGGGSEVLKDSIHDPYGSMSINTPGSLRA